MIQGYRDKRDVRGIGMTSARTRDRLVARLREHGIRSEAVLEQLRNVPRHLFVDEALASRAYEDTALPIGLGLLLLRFLQAAWAIVRGDRMGVISDGEEESRPDTDAIGSGGRS